MSNVPGPGFLNKIAETALRAVKALAQAFLIKWQKLKKNLEISSRVGQDLGSEIGNFGNYRGEGFLKVDFELKKSSEKSHFFEISSDSRIFSQISELSQAHILVQKTKGIILIYKWP
jgi:hypothetical protein